MHKISPSGRDDIFFIYAMEFWFWLGRVKLRFVEPGMARTKLSSYMGKYIGKRFIEGAPFPPFPQGLEFPFVIATIQLGDDETGMIPAFHRQVESGNLRAIGGILQHTKRIRDAFGAIAGKAINLFIYFPLSFTNGSSFNGSLLMQDYGSLV